MPPSHVVPKSTAVFRRSLFALAGRVAATSARASWSRYLRLSEQKKNAKPMLNDARPCARQTLSAPASVTILKRSAVLSFAGSISYHTPFLRESVGGDAEVLEVAPATRESARAPPPRLAAHAAVTEELRSEERRVGKECRSGECR